VALEHKYEEGTDEEMAQDSVVDSRAVKVSQK
jgi:hypothetical protein